MMNTMNNTGSVLGFATLWGVHVLAVILFFVGLIFLILWASKALNLGQLKAWGIGLVVVSTLVCLLTIAARGAMWHGNGMMGGSKMMRMEMMEEMMGGEMMDDDDECEGENCMDMDGDMMMDMDDGMMGMSMHDMSAMLEGKTGDAFDKAFIAGMIPHHQGAIDMAIAARESAGHQEIKDMAEAIISAQQSEIDMMRGWQEAWGYTE
jgi:hypothetical protein